jgi:hypothetical protein
MTINAAADAATDTGPLWLKIILGIVPLVAAVIGGAFLLTSTVNRRIERLKNLVELRKNLPSELELETALDWAIFSELKAIDHATTPILKWSRRLRVVVLTMGFLAYLPVLANVYAPAHRLLHIGVPLVNALGVFVGILAILFIADGFIFAPRRTAFRRGYSRHQSALVDSGALPSREKARLSDYPIVGDFISWKDSWNKSFSELKELRRLLKTDAPRASTRTVPTPPSTEAEPHESGDGKPAD